MAIKIKQDVCALVLFGGEIKENKDDSGRQYFQGFFSGESPDGEASPVNILRVWFQNDTSLELLEGLLTDEQFCSSQALLCVGRYREVEMTTGNTTKGLSNGFLARYNADGKFSYVTSEGVSVDLTGTPGHLVSIPLEIELQQVKATPSTPQKREPIDPEKRRAEREARRREREAEPQPSPVN